MFQSCLLCWGSRPDAGSSSRTILGDPDKAIAIDNRLFIPPDNDDTGLSFNSPKST